MNNIIKVTERELAKVDNNMLNKEQLNFLLGRTPKGQIYKRKAKGGGEWSYVTGTYIKKVLNLIFGWDWSFEVVEHNFDLNIRQAYVLGKLTVRSNGREVVKMQFGRVDIKFKTAWENGKKVSTNQPLDIGNDLKAATTDALKKCASELGIASDVYAPNEFKAIKVIDDSEMLTEINILLNDSEVVIAETDRMYIQKSIEDKEVMQYHRILNQLKAKKNEAQNR